MGGLDSERLDYSIANYIARGIFQGVPPFGDELYFVIRTVNVL